MVAEIVSVRAANLLLTLVSIVLADLISPLLMVMFMFAIVADLLQMNNQTKSSSLI
jgi:hypothetical protein